MPRAPWANDALYACGERFADECLRRDGSLFTPGEGVWTASTLEDFYERFVVQEQLSGGSFLERLNTQLEDASDETVQLAAEVLFFNFLSSIDTSAKFKTETVETVLGWMHEPAAVPSELEEVYETGIAAIGLAKTQKWQQLRFILEFSREWKELPTERREALLRDAWDFREFVETVPKNGASVQIEATLHLVFPDAFEPIVSPNVKRAIAETFAAVAGEDSNVDDQLERIRVAVGSAVGQDFTFYDPVVERVWKGESAQWGEFLHWARRLYESPSFDADERDYKLLLAERVREVRELLVSGRSDWLERLRQAFASPNNLTHWRAHSVFLEWCAGHPAEAMELLERVWSSEPTEVSLASVFEVWPAENSPGNKLAILSYLLMGVDASRFPVFRSTPFEKARKLLAIENDGKLEPEFDDEEIYRPEQLADLLGSTGLQVREFLRARYPREPDEKGADWFLTAEQAREVVDHFEGVGVPRSEELAKRYFEFLELLDEIRLRLLSKGVELRDRLDAQSLLWWITSADPPEDWSADERERFLAFQNGSPVTVPTGRRAWLVRGANNHGRNMLPEWFEEGFVSIGWDNATPHSTDATVDEIREHLRSDIPELPEGEVIRGAGIRRRFLDIAPDDLIVSPDGDALYVARASGDSEWHEGDDASALRHPVEWLNLDSPGSRAAVREETPSLWKRLRTLLTVSELTDDLEAVEALLDGGTHRVPTYADAAMIAAVSSQVAKRLFVPQSWLNEIVSLLNEKKQVIFYGPPGTGKTWFARELGRHVVASGGAVSLVQFHPAYAYEDFFEGYRPSHDGEGLDFRLRAGPLRRIADEARRAPDVPHLLVVDEINRGQIAKIFGELYFLLEYREEPIQLQYSPDEEFSLPENLFFIGTMNTADRSIALVDSALRRRFYFVGFFPQSEPLSEVLGEWLEAEGYPQDAAEYQRGLNAALADAGTDEEFAIGHAYFMTKHGSPDVNRIWARAILPLLEERFYGARKRGEIEEEFAPEAIRRRIEAKTEEAQTDS